MGHINARSLELLNKTDANGCDSAGEYRIDFRAIEKSIEQPHPTRSNGQQSPAHYGGGQQPAARG